MAAMSIEPFQVFFHQSFEICLGPYLILKERNFDSYAPIGLTVDIRLRPACFNFKASLFAKVLVFQLICTSLRSKRR